MPKCSYCGKMYNVHEGVTLVLKDGTIKYLCASKCRKNMNMGRRRVRWVEKREEKELKKSAPEKTEKK